VHAYVVVPCGKRVLACHYQDLDPRFVTITGDHGGTLRDVPYEPLASAPDMPRWKNAAQWARNSMVKEGLLRSNSPRGIWESSEAGTRFLHDEGS
jgi:Mrr N-terminal domain